MFNRYTSVSDLIISIHELKYHLHATSIYVETLVKQNKSMKFKIYETLKKSDDYLKHSTDFCSFNAMSFIVLVITIIAGI